MPSQIKYRDLDWDPLSIIFHPVTMRNIINNMEEKNIYEKKNLHMMMSAKSVVAQDCQKQ